MAGLIIAGFGAIGKTTLAQKYKNVIDLESSLFKYLIDDELKKLSVEERKGLKSRKLNPDYPENYYQAIVDSLKTADIVLISVQKDILAKLQDNNIEYIKVYPKEEMLDELVERCIKRGNTEEYISKMGDAFFRWYPSENEKVLWLNNGEYLEDVLIQNQLLKEKNNMLEKDFKDLVLHVKQDILKTRYDVRENANIELINLYFRIGKIISENSKYGNNFIKSFSTSLKLEFPDATGFSERNLSRMKKFYEEYKELSILPPVVAKLPWTHNCILLDKVKDISIRDWYASKCYENGWAKTVLEHQIDLQLYERQVLSNKLTNFENKLSLVQSELARDIIKDPYIFELEGIKEEAIERDVENAMMEKIKNVLLELGKGFSFVGNQYKISTENQDYYIDMLFYHLDLRCYIVVELKNIEFKPDYIGQLSFYVTAVDETLRKEHDNQTIGLLLCKGKDRLSVEWALKSTSTPIGVSSYEIRSVLPKEIMDKLPTEEDINRYIDINDKD